MTSPFPFSPLHLQSEVQISSASGAKPNVLLFIDDSASMRVSIDKTRYARFSLLTSWSQYTDYVEMGSEEYYKYKNDSRYYERDSKTMTRLDTTQKILSDMVNQYQDKMRWAVYTTSPLASSEKLPFPSNYEDPNNWKNALASIQKIGASGNISPTLAFLNLSNKLMDAPHYRCQKSYVIMMASGRVNSGMGSVYEFSNYFYDYDDFLSNPSNTIRYTPKPDNSNINNLGQFTRKLATQDYKVAAHGKDASGQSWDDPAFPKQTIDTFVIGFNNEFTESDTDFLRSSASTDDKYFLADNNDKLAKTFGDIFSQVSDANQIMEIEAHSIAAPMITSSNINGMAASATLDTGSWSSQLRFYQIDPRTHLINTKKWNTPYFPAQRKVLTSANGQYQLLNDLALNNAFFGINNANNAQEWQEALLPWLTRSKDDKQIASWAKQAKSAITYRERQHEDRQIGDILDSPILAFGAQNPVNKRSKYVITAANDGMLYIFTDSKSAADSHDSPYNLAFNYLPMSMQRQSTDNSDTVAKYYRRVAGDDYGTDKEKNRHVFLMNGGISVRTTAPNNNNQTQSFLAANMGEGGRGMFALNLSGTSLATGQDVGIETSEDSWPNTVPLFETGKGESNHLGYTVSTPQIGRVSVNHQNDSKRLQEHVRYATFLANGYNSPSTQETALYIQDALGADVGLAENKSLNSQYQAGQLIQKITVPGSSLGLSTPLLVDTNFDGLVDIVYAGGYDGNLYRFDLRAQDPSLWTVHTVYEGDPNQPITASPAISRLEGKNGRYVVTFGTGSDFYQKDLTNNHGQSIIGIYDDIDRQQTISSKTELLAQTFQTQTIGGKSFRFLSNHHLGANHKGWLINLDASNGERITTAPEVVLKTAVFNSRIYDNQVTEIDNGHDDKDLCQSSQKTIKSDAQSWLMAINVLNGGGLTGQDAKIEFSTNGQLVQLDNYFANGQKYPGLSNFTLVQQDKGNSLTADGSMKDVGIDEKLGQLTQQSNTCLQAASQVVVNDSTGQMDIHQLSGPSCQSSLKRLSWKEIH